MTNHEKKQYLLSYQPLVDAIDRREEDIERIESLAEKVTTTISDMPKGSPTSNIEDTYVMLIELKQDLLRKTHEWVYKKRIIERAIDNINSMQLQNVLRYKYIDNLTWEQIAVKMNFSYYYVVKELHSQALTILQIPQITPR